MKEFTTASFVSWVKDLYGRYRDLVNCLCQVNKARFDSEGVRISYLVRKNKEIVPEVQRKEERYGKECVLGRWKTEDTRIIEPTLLRVIEEDSQ